MKFLFTLFAALLLSHSEAFATGGYECTIDDSHFRLTAGGGLTRSIPSSPFNEYGEMGAKNASYIGFDNIKIEKASQFWNHGGELNVLFYAEPENMKDFSTITVVIKTKYVESSTDDYSFHGGYEAVIQQGEASSSFTGKVKCWME